MSELIEYKCPNCGGALEFNADLQKMKCPFCDSEFDVATLEALDNALHATEKEDELHWDETSGQEWDPAEVEHIRHYVCKSCGGEIIGDETTGATTCPFCGNPVTISEQFAGGLRPDKIIPFKVNKDEAKAALARHLKGKRLLPKVFQSQNHIDEIKGIYVPFWIFDAEADGKVTYEGTRVRHWSDRDYDYTETSYFNIYREGTVDFANIPADASAKMADDLMDSLEPFDFSEAVDFQTAYFAGYLADKYDVSRKDCEPRINARVKQSTEDVLRSTITQPYDSIMPTGSCVQVTNGKVRYALLPVWLLNTSWNGQQYTFAMNGQTGKFVGNLPTDKKRLALYTAGSFFGSAAVGTGLGFLINYFFL